MEGKFISYLRVSTAKQGINGHGIRAQRQAIENYLNGGGWELLGEYVEQESGRKNDRPQLDAALEHCRLTGATLVIAKLDRLSRNAAFLLQLQDAGVKFVAADNPQANNLTVGLLAVIAQDEAQRISERTKAGLQAARAKGVKLGNPNGAAHLGSKHQHLAAAAVKGHAQDFAAALAPTVQAIQEQGHTSLSAIARELNARSIKTARGGKWHASTVKNLLNRIQPQG
jgi:DNA invertase Pin-like site-specific DNA recombinase